MGSGPRSSITVSKGKCARNFGKLGQIVFLLPTSGVLAVKEPSYQHENLSYFLRGSEWKT